jgi:(2Fe-2S) ferredoxin
MSSSLSAEALANFRKIEVEVAQRHVFLCIGPDCCAPTDGEATWNYLKKALKEHGIPALRTKAACLRVCADGPWMVVYPDGVWYGRVDVARCERIVREHLLLGRPVEEWVIKRHPLTGGGQMPSVQDISWQPGPRHD